MAKRWYVVHTYSGYENKVKTDLERRIESYGLQRQVVDIQIPTEEVTELKEDGKRQTKENKVFPGYVLVRMEVDDNTWSVVRNTPGVTGKKMMGNATPKGDTAPRRTVTDFEPGQAIRVTSGPLEDFDGTISEVNPESGKIKVTLLIFGRETPVELSVDQVVLIH